jgi:hypothetical protein
MNFTADIATEGIEAVADATVERTAEESDAETYIDAALPEMLPTTVAEISEAEELSPDTAPEPQVDAAPGEHNHELNDESAKSQ